MQIVLNIAKCIKPSSRVSSKSSTCIQRRNNNQQHEDSLEKATWCYDVKRADNQNLCLCLHPEAAKPEGYCCQRVTQEGDAVGL